MLNTDPQTYRIIGAAIEVHRELGSGFVERVYHEALKIKFDLRLRFVFSFPDTKFAENLAEQLLGINLTGDFSDGVERAPEVD